MFLIEKYKLSVV